MSTSAAAVIDRYARKRLERHLKAKHWTFWPEILMIAGVAFAALGLYFLEHAFDAILGGIFFGGCGWVWRYWRSLFVATPKEFDHIAETDFTAAQSVALERFELTAADLLHAEPCKFRSATTKRDIGQAVVGVRIGADEKPRRTPHEYLIVNFGRSHLLLFNCVWDLTSGNTLWEETVEFAYRDIASVLLSHKKETIRVNMKTREFLPMWKAAGFVPVNGRVQLPTDESVALSLVSGEQVQLFAWKRSGGGIPSGEGKKSFQSAQRLQKLVRELKHQQAVSPTAAGTPNQVPATIRERSQ